MEYLPLPIKPIISYTPTAISKATDSYTPEVTKEVSQISYTPSKINDPPVESIKEVEPEESHNKIPEKPKSAEKETKSDSESKKSSRRSSSSSHHKKSSSKDRHRSSSSSHRSSSSSHKSSRSSSRHKSSHHSKSSSSNGHKHKHKSKERSRSKDRESKKRKIEEKSEKTEPVIDLPSDIELDDDQDDIEAQCRMIFENYQPETNEEANQPTKSTPSNSSNANNYTVDVGKKRQAHENAISTQKPMTVRTNHFQSALVTAQRRQEIAIQKALTEKKAREEEIAKLQEDIKKREDEMDSSKTPLVNPLMFVRPPKRMIAPISQRMAIEAAKRKVMELNRGKESPYAQTTAAQTASKSTGVKLPIKIFGSKFKHFHFPFLTQVVWHMCLL